MEYGAQIIPFRTQIPDIYLHLMSMFFKKGSRNSMGYRLKPPAEQNNYHDNPKNKEMKISITPISASFIFSNE